MISNHHQRWVLDQFPELREVRGANGAIYDPVIAAKTDPHALAGDNGSLVIHNRDIADAADAEDRRLRRIDDGGELIHAVRAEIADGNRAAGELVRAEF